MIYIITNTKGGVGKSTTATTLACTLFAQKRAFKIIELDNNNTSMLFGNSEILKDKAISLKLDEKVKAIGGMVFNIAKNQDMDYIIDVGGGDDINRLLDSLKEIHLQKTWIIPTTSDRKYLKNAADTFRMIDDSENTYFVLNRVFEIKNVENEFMYFFGSQKYGVKAVDSNFCNSKWMTIPSSMFFQLAEDDEQTLLDLALISIEKDEAEITQDFLKIAKDDEVKFVKLWENYERSKEAAKIYMKIDKSFKKLFLKAK